MADKQESQQITDTTKVEMYRTPNLFWRVVIAVFILSGLFVAINQIFLLRLLGRLEFELAFLYTLEALLLSLVFILFPATKKASRSRVPWYDILLFGLTLLLAGYLASQGSNIWGKGWVLIPPVHIGIMAFPFCLLVFEALRRTGGQKLLLICLLFAFYPTFAYSMPGLLQGSQFSFWHTAVYHVLSDGSIGGMLMQVYGKLLVGFLLFGVVLVVSGGGEAFMKLALALLGAQKGGPAKVAIVASALFGSMSGSVVSNVVTTGSFTIPTMKKTGYPAYFAGAIEACASTGGCIMPPVMGTAAFLMAAFLGISYFSVCLAAAIPALLYYFGLFMQVHAYAETHNLRGLPRSEIPALKQAVQEAWPYLFAILTLVYFLYLGLAGRAPFASSAILLILAMTRKKTRSYVIKDPLKHIIEVGKMLCMLIGLLAGLGLIVGSVSITGLGASFAHEVTALAGGNVLLLLIFGALGSFVLGMGMTVTVCYIFLAIVMVPALVGAGLNPLAVHLFVLYWGLASFLTPPVALGAYTAAGIAGSDPVKTGFQSMRLGFLVYFLPFCFVFCPALVLQGSLIELIFPLASIILGIFLITGSVEGYLIKFGHMPSLYLRIPLFISGVLLCIPGWQTDVAGICLFLLTRVVPLVAKRKVSPVTVSNNRRRR